MIESMCELELDTAISLTIAGSFLCLKSSTSTTATTVFMLNNGEIKGEERSMYTIGLGTMVNLPNVMPIYAKTIS